MQSLDNLGSAEGVAVLGEVGDGLLPRVDVSSFCEVSHRAHSAWRNAAQVPKRMPNPLGTLFSNRKQALLDRVRTEGAINDALAAELKAAVGEFKQTYR